MDLVLRLCGLAAIGVSLATGLLLGHLGGAGRPYDPTALEYLMAALSFAFASIGAALLICGKKLLDCPPVSRRWRHYR